MRPAAVDLAYEVIDMYERIQQLEFEVARLRDYERKYHDEVMAGIRHGEKMMSGLFAIAMTPGVLGALSANKAPEGFAV